MHLAAENFLSLIPALVSDENLQILEVDEKKEIIDVPVASKRRILAGEMIFLTLKTHFIMFSIPIFLYNLFILTLLWITCSNSL